MITFPHWSPTSKRFQDNSADPTRFTPPAAFTLIELLVVISIIAILAGLLLPVVSKVMVNAQKVQAKNTETQVVAAVKNFYTEYGVYPIPTTVAPPASGQTASDICFGSNNPTQAQLFDILRADTQGTEASVNTRGIVYLELPTAKDLTAGKSKNGIGADGMLYDPWGTIYYVGLDANYDGVVNNPYKSNAGFNPLQTACIVYSWGPDKKSTSDFFNANGDKNDADNMDDVISWQ